jgi:hypothetical protein
VRVAEFMFDVAGNRKIAGAVGEAPKHRGRTVGNTPSLQ